jgi:hypothetical protein
MRFAQNDSNLKNVILSGSVFLGGAQDESD